MAVKQKNSWQTVVLILFAFLSIFFVVSIKNSNTSHKKEISLLQTEKNELQEKLDNSVSKDSVLFYLLQQKQLLEIIHGLNIQIDSLNKIQYESTDFNKLPLDSNVVILSRNLPLYSRERQ